MLAAMRRASKRMRVIKHQRALAPTGNGGRDAPSSPARGRRSPVEMSYLAGLYRARAEKAGITYVNIWDGSKHR
jgi:hypothetical protein